MKKLLILLLIFISNSTAFSQADQNFHVQSLNPDKYAEKVALFVKADKIQLLEYLKLHDGKYKYSSNGYHGVTISVSLVKDLFGQPFITGSDFTLHRPVALNDTMRVTDNINPIHAGQNPLDTAYTGKGVIVGIIDTGIELQHGDFKDANGKTRILRIWDQTFPFDAQYTPAFYGYGQVWDSAYINSGACTHYDYGNGHGSTVTGTAAGNGLANGYHKGVAPESHLIIVGSNFNAANWLGTVADAVDYIFKVADTLQMPVVINASIGDYYGSHDGTDPAALFIDSLIDAKPGRLLVGAAGNSGNVPAYHLHHTTNPTDTNFTWFKYNGGSFLGYGSVFFEGYADTLAMDNLYYAVGANLDAGSFADRGQTSFVNIHDHLGTTFTDTILNNGNIIGIVDFYAEQQGAVYMLQVHIQEPDSNTYNFRFITAGTGEIDIWSTATFGTSSMVNNGIPTSAVLPEIVNYVSPDSSQIIVSSFSCGQNTILVGNYYGMQQYIDYNGNLQTLTGTVGSITLSSSRGPSRDLRLKPDIAASGDIHMSAAPFPALTAMIAAEPHKVAFGGMHIRNGGTSMASPVVTGIAALALQKCKWLTADEFKTMLTSTAKTDAFTNVVPNISYGYGKVDGFAALNTKNYSASLAPVTTTTICNSDSVQISTDQAYSGYQWSTGETTASIQAQDSTGYHALVFDALGCRARTDTVSISFFTGPTAQITLDSIAANLISNSATTYQWFFDGDTIVGATNQTFNYAATGNGFYELCITDANGCNDCEFIILNFTSIEENELNDISIYPNPAREMIYVSSKQHLLFNIKLMDAAGKMIAYIPNINNPQEIISFDMKDLARGIYFIEAETGNGKMVKKVVRE